jgi:hypothetical protein
LPPQAGLQKMRERRYRKRHVGAMKKFQFATIPFFGVILVKIIEINIFLPFPFGATAARLD